MGIMDANTRKYLEIEGYRELGLWQEATQLLEALVDEIPGNPPVLGYLATLGVAVEFGGFSKKIPSFFTPSPAYAQSAWGQAQLSKL